MYARRMERILMAESAGQARRAPAGRTALHILALVLGAVGIFTGLNTATELITTGASSPVPELSRSAEIEQVMSIYEEMNQEIAAANAEHRVRQATFAAAHLAVSVGLLVGAVGGLRAKPSANCLLVAACCGGIFFELAHLMPGIRDAQQANQVMQRDVPRMLRALSGPAASDGADGISPPASALVRAVGKTRILTTLAAVLFKAIFYCIGLRALTQVAPDGRRSLCDTGPLAAEERDRTPHEA